MADEFGDELDRVGHRCERLFGILGIIILAMTAVTCCIHV